MSTKYPLQLQVRVNEITIKQIKAITKRHRRNKSEMVRLLIEREACRPSDPASLLATCGGEVLAEVTATGNSSKG